MFTLPVNTVYQLVNRMETEFPDRVAIRFYNPEKEAVEEILYRQYAQDIRRVAASLQAALPDIEGRRVCILAANSYHYAVSIFGTVLAGAVAVPLNLQKSWDDIQYELELVEASAILHDGLYLEREPALGEEFGEKLLPIDGYRAFAPAETRECADRDALMAVMFTSGTTGRSKGVMLSQKNLFAPMPAYCSPFGIMLKQMGVDHYDFSSFTVLPMFHIAAFTSLVSWAIMGMAHNLCTDLRNFYRDLALMPSDVMAAVPVLLQTIHRDVMRGRQDRLGRLRTLTCGAASCTPQMMLDLMDHGFFIMQMYGLTETSGDGTWNNDQSAAHIHSVGVGDEPTCEYSIQEGELCIKGDPVMLGYYKEPEKTAEVLIDGWFHTGDLVRKDEDGYYYITGRKKNLIILASGENVSPEELEKLVSACPDVQECMVREKDGKICAEVFCPAEAQDAVRAHITEANRSLPLYKRMALVEFRAEPFARNATGKLVRS